jgi:hypothetical protein
VEDHRRRRADARTTARAGARKIQTTNASVLLRDAGIIAFEDAFDLTAGEFISSDMLVNRARTPEADCDFTRSCELISRALT